MKKELLEKLIRGIVENMLKITENDKHREKIMYRLTIDLKINEETIDVFNTSLITRHYCEICDDYY
jgi:coenzyme F420-reducing hydrogenase beta subunit